ncbi:ornithine cyclodeaminase family protein [Halobacillus amylolyticus]|uniref:Ornithine cyclodeaminase family protein n=1 Tax=Halobacillus amylolyticus TaxID=2932259 RepID=A0ABY4H805_9BACI|nr:ornithine cyclodeaminase family protein [Halobacillus amylolyticus]
MLAIMDSSYLTAVRTGLAGALGTHTLSRKEAKNVAIVGSGVQGRTQLKSLSYFRSISRVYVFDTNSQNSIKFVDEMSKELKTSFIICERLEEALMDADIIITATWSKVPFIYPEMIKEGTHITTLGADQPGKFEVSPNVLGQSVIVCDDVELGHRMGVLQDKKLKESIFNVYELGEVLGSQRCGRADSNQTTIFGCVGLAFQDLIIAWEVFQKAVKNDVGSFFEFHK